MKNLAFKKRNDTCKLCGKTSNGVNDARTRETICEICGCVKNG